MSSKSSRAGTAWRFKANRAKQSKPHQPNCNPLSNHSLCPIAMTNSPWAPVALVEFKGKQRGSYCCGGATCLGKCGRLQADLRKSAENHTEHRKGEPLCQASRKQRMPSLRTAGRGMQNQRCSVRWHPTRARLRCKRISTRAPRIAPRVHPHLRRTNPSS